MKKFALGLSLLGLTSFAFVSCDDDDGNGDMDAGVDAGPAMCKGAFSTLTRVGLGQSVNPAGACAMPTDLDVICANDVGAITRGAGFNCFLTQPTTEARALCTAQSVQGMIEPDLTASCLNCYIQAVNCTTAMCASECTADPAAAACTACQIAQGCLPTFFACSGLPAPGFGGGGAGGAGGTGGTGGTGGGGAGGTTPDAGTDAATDAGQDGAVDAADDAATDANAG